MLRKMVVLAILWGGTLIPLQAQSNDRLDELLAQAPARLDSTAYLVLSEGALVSEDSTPADAFQAAVTAGLLPKGSVPEGTVSVQTLSYLVLKALKFQGGLEWTFLPSPRAAYRELAYRQLINTSAGPDRTVAGDEVVRTLSAVRTLQGGAP